MAKSRTIIRTIAARAPMPTIRIAAPMVKAAGRRAGRLVRRGASAAGRGVVSEKHTLTALMAAGALGLAEKSGVSIPTIGPLGPAATLGIASWIYGRVTKSAVGQHVATGLLSVAINRWAATGVIAGEGFAGNAVVFDDD